MIRSRSSSPSKMLLMDNVVYPDELSFMDGDMEYSARLHMNFNNMFFSHCQLCGVPPSLQNPYPFYTLGFTGVGVHAACAVHAAYLNSLKESKRINLPFSSLPPLPPPSYSTLYPHLQMNFNILLPDNNNYINGFQLYGQQPQLISGFQSYGQQPQYSGIFPLAGFQSYGQQTQYNGFAQYNGFPLAGFQSYGQQTQYNGFPLDGFQRQYGIYNNYYYQAAAPAPKYTKYIVNAYHYTGDSNPTKIVNNNNNNNNSGYEGWKGLVFSFVKAVGARVFSPYY